MYVRDLVAGTTELESVASDGTLGNSSSTGVGISADGRWVSFSSFANNLVPGDTNDSFDVFLHDRQTGDTQLISQNSDEQLGDQSSFSSNVSADGRSVVFYSNATNLIPDDTQRAQRRVRAGHRRRDDRAGEHRRRRARGRRQHTRAGRPRVHREQP